MPDLQPSQFPATLYHGSVHELEGDTLMPAYRMGATTPGQDPHRHLGQSRREVVSATANEDKAWNFAAYSSAGQKGRVRVHVVEPNSDTRVGVENQSHPEFQKAFEEKRWRKPEDSDEWVAPHFKVRETLDTRPGRQGTFPQVNWKDFKRPGTKTLEGKAYPDLDVNHPNDPPQERAAQRSRQRRLGEELSRDQFSDIEKKNLTLF